VDEEIPGRVVIVSSMGGLLTAYGLGAYCASKHALEAIAASLRDELASTGVTVQTINPGAYDTGFNDRIAETTYRWHDDAVNFTREADIRANFAKIMQESAWTRPVQSRVSEPAWAARARRREGAFCAERTRKRWCDTRSRGLPPLIDERLVPILVRKLAPG
jgi:NAD(P)-dependent dehydrogenase (short-subunit alcohol dehydrogenase family)